MRFIGLDWDTLGREPDGLSRRPAREDSPVRPAAPEAIASPKLVPKHQHDQRGPSLAVVSLLPETQGKALPDKL